MYPNKVKTQDVVAMYTKEHLTLREIAGKIKVSHTAIWNHLKKAGINREAGTWVQTECAFCGNPVLKRRQKFRNHPRTFCNSNCYLASRENPNYKPWRHGSRLAVAIVSQWFKIPPDAIVHHKDSDQRHNDLANLAVFTSQSDHMKHHHGRTKVDPIWDGANP